MPAKGYRVDVPPGWEAVASEADLALRRPEGAGGLMVHGTCEGPAPRRPLPVLARHLRFGLRDVRRLEEGPVTVAGRPGRRAHFTGRLDGLAVEVEAVTVAGPRCVYDLAVVAPAGRLAAVAADFARLTGSFVLTGGGP